MTVHDIKLVELLLCAADICFSRPDINGSGAITEAFTRIGGLKAKHHCDAVDAAAKLLAKPMAWHTREEKGLACLEAARQIEEQRGVLR